MLEFLKSTGTDAIALIKNDHRTAEALFKKFEDAKTVKDKKSIADQAILELKIHTAIEEEIFYPAVRGEIEDDLMNEADEEHHVAKLLIAELEIMDGTEDHYQAKFKVLTECVKHHVKEEETEMLPKSRTVDIDLEALGAEMLARKEELKRTGVATFAEEAQMRASRRDNDSPAQAARGKKPAATSARSAVKTGVRAKAGAHKSAVAKSAPKATARSKTAGKMATVKKAKPAAAPKKAAAAKRAAPITASHRASGRKSTRA